MAQSKFRQEKLIDRKLIDTAENSSRLQRYKHIFAENMKQKQIVSIVIRVIGLLGLMKICRHWFAYAHRNGTLLGDHRWDMFFEILLFFLGVYMVMGAPLLLNIIIKDDDGDEIKK